MPLLSDSEFLGEGPAPSPPAPSLARIDPAVQAQRDLEARRIRTAELQPNGGGLIPTSTVIEGSKAGRFPGQLVPGNIDLFNRPQVKNPDGSISTVKSSSFNIDGREVLLPLVGDEGKIISEDEAIRRYKKTGKHLGIFDTPDNATKYALDLHKQQENYYVKGKGKNGSSLLSDEDFLGTKAAPKSEWKSPVSIQGFKTAVGNVAALGDMVLSIPGQLIGIGGDLAGRAAAIGSGESRRVGALAGAEGRELGEPLMNPLQKLMKAMGYGESYDKSHVAGALQTLGSWIDKGGNWIEKRTGGALLKEDVDSLVNTLMAGGGVRGVKATEDFLSARPGTPGNLPPPGPSPIRRVEGELLPPEDLGPRKLLPAPRPAPKLLEGPEKAEMVREGQADVARLTQEIEGLKSTELALRSNPDANLNASRADLEFKQSVAGERMGNLKSALTKLTGEVPPWAKNLGIGAAAYAAAEKEGHGDEALIGLGLLGAMKAKGGMWHPKAAEVLAEPLAGSAVGLRGGLPDLATLRALQAEDNLRPEYATAIPVMEWAQKASQTYLNRHMGTEGDPLREIEIPFGEGTKKWGEVTEALVKSHPISNAPSGWAAGMPIEQQVRLMAEKPNEPVWDFKSEHDFSRADERNDQPVAMAHAFKSYLSHVGDYLRQNVDPSKLPQYDLVRAVKETAKNDERVAREMEKEAAASSAELPVYKEYPDGFKWVELRLPERLTEGQAATVSNYAKIPNAYTVRDAAGKPISNAYTGEEVTGNTPEEAWLAGQLAREGNQMGHCVGGYCEGVASGESRIFSLRDPKGKSHVTIEVEPYKKGWSSQDVDWREETPDGENILQIKGKQNRAPSAPYLPYVQDFVRGGKWGEVGDLENTGLLPYRTARGGQDPYVYKPGTVDQSKIDLEPGYYTKEELHQANLKAGGELDPRFPADEAAITAERKFRGQEGSISPRLLSVLAAAGVGTLLGTYLDDNHLRGAILGAIGGTLIAGGRSGPKLLDQALGSSSTRLGNASPAVLRRARDFELNVMRDTARNYDRVIPFIKGFESLPKGQKAAVDMAYMRNEDATIRSLLADKPELLKSYGEVRKLLDEFKVQFQGLKRFKEGLTDYLPLIVKDFEGLKAALGQEARSGLEKMLFEAEAEMLKTRGRGLTDVEQSVITNNFLRAREQTSHQPGYAKERELTVTEATRPFYADVKDSLLRYVAEATKDIETARFFGKDLRTSSKGGKQYTNVDDSIGELVSREMREKKISPDQAIEMSEILRARFGPGEQAPVGALQDLRNFNNATLLGQFHSAGTQIADSPMAIYHHGLRPTLEALVMKVAGRGVKPADFGLVNHIAEEFTSSRTSGRVLTKLLKLTGFSAIDQFGKSLQLTAALRKNQRLARSESGRAQLAAKWAEAYGDDFPRLVRELQAGKRTPTVDSLLFGGLSNIQPISKLELPELYNRFPNGRLMYQMKTYMLKQIDVVRRDVYNEVRKGDTRSVARGLKNAAALATMLALAGVPGNAVKDWLSGQQIDLTPDLIENLLQNFGISRYSMDQARQGKPIEVARDAVLPPYKHYQDIAKMNEKSVRYIPPAGRIYYDRMLGGAERRQAAKERAQRRREREN